MSKPRRISLTTITEILGVTHQRTSAIVRKPDFQPGRPRGQHRLWDRREVTAWAKEWRKEKPWR